MAKLESTAINAMLHDLQAKRVERASARNLFAIEAEHEVPEVPFVPKARQQATLEQPLPQIPSIAQPAAQKIRYAADSTPVRTARGTDAPPVAQQLAQAPMSLDAEPWPGQPAQRSRRAQPAHTPRPQQPERSLHVEPQYVQQTRGRQRPLFADNETVVSPQPELQRAEIAHARSRGAKPKFVPGVATVL